MATFWEIATRSVSNLFSLYFVFCNIYLFPVLVCFKSGICLLIAPVPVHCFSITSVSFEQCIKVTGFKKFDNGNIVPKSMEHFLHFLKIMYLRHFSDSPQIYRLAPVLITLFYHYTPFLSMCPGASLYTIPVASLILMALF